jgi:hypothetical protein
MTEEPKEKIETQIPIDEADKQKAKTYRTVICQTNHHQSTGIRTPVRTK